MRILRAAGVTFSAIGILILLFVFYELVGTTAVTKLHQSALRKEFRRALETPAPSRDDRTVAAPAGPEATTKRARRGDAVARLVIPRIDLDVIVVEGVSRSDLAKGPGHYPDTEDLGASGSAGIAGHRTGWSAPFFDIDRLRKGDSISLETNTATYVYAVTGKVIVAPDQVWVLNGDPDSPAPHRLTLTTCTPKFTARDRLIVWADLVRTIPRTSMLTEAA